MKPTRNFAETRTPDGLRFSLHEHAKRAINRIYVGERRAT